MTSSVRDFRDLVAWQRAMDLAVACERVSAELPPKAGHLALQIRRTAISIPANIAEGNGRTAISIPANIAEGNGRVAREEYLRYLSIANGSLKELESHLVFVARVYGTTEALEEARRLCGEVGRLLNGLRKSLS